MSTNDDEQVLIQDPSGITEEQRLALAKMYADDGFRGFLIHAAQVSNKNALTCLKSRNFEGAGLYATRAESFSEILNLSKRYFTHYDRIKKTTLSTEETKK